MSQDETPPREDARNRERAFCPVKNEVVELGHCAEVHRLWMHGRQEVVEDDLCYMARRCFKCPFRHAVKAQGDWADAGVFPFAAEPRDKVRRFPERALAAAKEHSLPYASEYARRGLRLGAFDDAFRRLGTPGLSLGQSDALRASKPGDKLGLAAPSPRKGANPAPAKPAPAKPAPPTMKDASESLADAIGRAVRDEDE